MATSATNPVTTAGFSGLVRQRVRQPSKISFDISGIATCTQTYEVVDKTNVLNLLPNAFAPHPVYTALLNDISEMTVTESENSALISCKYKGIFVNQVTFSGPATYELVDGISQEPIDTHPKFVSTIGGTKASPKNSAIFDDNGKFTGFPPDAGNQLGGVTHYRVANLTWKETFSQLAPLDALTNVAKVANPQGPAPQLNTGYQWMLVSITQTREGGSHKVTYSYEVSDGRGWNSLIYGT